jgi:hypothetical protein
MSDEAAPATASDTDVTYCAAHPGVETALRCGKCGTYICPRCLVQTPVGARCRECARLRRIPTYHIPAAFLLRGAVAALVAGGVAGAGWWLFDPLTGFFFGAPMGLAVGYLVREAVSLATNRKAGPPLQLLAGAGVLLAFFVRNVALGEVLPRDDVAALIAVIIAVMVAIGRVRF